MFYKVAYRVGFTPWEAAAMHSPTLEQVSALFAREERGRQPPYGQALDLGCGTGWLSLNLAARGWQVTGVDIVPKALRTARERAQDAGVDVRFVRGDVTALRPPVSDSDFRLLLDSVTFHDLNDAQREAMAREVSAVAAADATLLMLAFARAQRGPGPRGASRGDIEAAFTGWHVIDEEAAVANPKIPAWAKADPRWYRLRRD
jgi:SAM-dependent methyltransferase